jgi:serine/threonine protein kinase
MAAGMKFKKSSIIANCYEILKSFQGGGMGLVHQALHIPWNIEVAIKHPRVEFLKSHRQIEDFHTECATWASIGLDPYVATCFYSRELEGLPCVVAEYLPGGSLQDAIQCREVYRGDEEHCLSLLLSIAASSAWGLLRAHKARLLHCDVKPGNMLLTNFGTAKIADFGLASVFRPSLEVKAKGLTVAFSSPEQLRGDALTQAADVWSWAASMLAMFMGGVVWESGAACGAVLQQFLDDGAKAYRIPAMPASFASLLKDCLQFSVDARVSDFNFIASQVCQCYEEIFDEPCPAGKVDLELISADSFNNRAVSRYDIEDLTEVHRLLEAALIVDPLHPEANFNKALLSYSAIGKFENVFCDQLLHSTKYDLGEYRSWIYLACLSQSIGHEKVAEEYLKKALDFSDQRSSEEIQRLWQSCLQSRLTPVLAPPISGEDFAQDSERFHRLMDKARVAIDEKRNADANRYLLMSGDISGFARHPQRRRLLGKISTIL